MKKQGFQIGSRNRSRGDLGKKEIQQFGPRPLIRFRELGGEWAGRLALPLGGT